MCDIGMGDENDWRRGWVRMPPSQWQMLPQCAFGKRARADMDRINKAAASTRLLSPCMWRGRCECEDQRPFSLILSAWRELVRNGICVMVAGEQMGL